MFVKYCKLVQLLKYPGSHRHSGGLEAQSSSSLMNYSSCVAPVRIINSGWFYQVY